MRILICVLAVFTVWSARADEGMWTFDNFPAAAVQQTYGVNITADWLEHVQLSTVRLSNCTASFVSSEGLLLTNHHCVESCLAELSNKDQSLLDLGYIAADRKSEMRCSTQIADVLVNMQNVTDDVLKSVAGLKNDMANAARKKKLTTLEQECEATSAKSKSGRLKCQAVTLYEGGQYFIYKYKRYDDVRLVMAPEADISAFGGDPDNFQFPRWCLDFSFLRVYEHGKPAKIQHFLTLDFAGPKMGQLVFVSGHPGSTSRLDTRAQLEFERDLPLPTILMRAAELRGRYLEFGRTKPGNEALVEAPLNALQNGIKVRRKLLDALHDDELLKRKSADETALRSGAQLTGADPWQQIDAALQHERQFYLPYTFLENGTGFNSILFRYARLLVRGAVERQKPNTERLREYTDAALPRIEQQLVARVPIYAEVETLTLSFSLERMREWLGPDDAVVHTMMSQSSPNDLAMRLIAESKLDDAAVRKQLWDGGKAAIDASKDPMILLAKAVDGQSRSLRKRYEDEVEAPIAVASESIAAARFKVTGTNVYPDATFTLRLNYGTVGAWTENGVALDPFTHLSRAFERATGASPFKIPESWIKAKAQLDMNTPFDMSTTNDIVGGNSGSPLIDVNGHIVGLMFDGNIHSIAGSYWFDATKNRAIAVHPAIIRESLTKVYHAQALLTELGGG